MDDIADNRLLSMAQSLEEHARLARELDLDFVAQLIGMAVLEIKMKCHNISEFEVETFCLHLDQTMEAKKRLSVAALEPGPQKQRRRRIHRRGYRSMRHLHGNSRNRSGIS
jgi:hypothetical protein